MSGSSIISWNFKFQQVFYMVRNETSSWFVLDSTSKKVQLALTDNGHSWIPFRVKESLGRYDIIRAYIQTYILLSVWCICWIDIVTRTHTVSGTRKPQEHQSSATCKPQITGTRFTALRCSGYPSTCLTALLKQSSTTEMLLTYTIFTSAS